MMKRTETRQIRVGEYGGYVSWDGERFYITAAREGSPLSEFLDKLAEAASECVHAFEVKP